MTIWIQSLSWTLIYSLGQGFVVYASLLLVLKLVPALTANARYHLSLSALILLSGWFAVTWWQQFHALQPVPGSGGVLLLRWQADAATGPYTTEHPLSAALKTILPWLSAAYLTGLSFLLARLGLESRQLFLLRKSSFPLPGDAPGTLLEGLKSRTGIHSGIRLLGSATARVPMVIGFLKPIILVPASLLTQLSPMQLETILLHELAHIKRHDYLINILQTIVETMLFFNPFTWWISGIIRREREYCCDDLVLEYNPERSAYASALAAIAAGPESSYTFSVAASGQRHHLLHRIKRIMEMNKSPFSYSRMLATILILTGITVSAAWLTPSFALPESKSNKTGIAAPSPTPSPVSPAGNQEELLLVKRLSDDRMINEVKGFIIEKKQDKLYINGKQQTDEVADKYLYRIKKEDIRIEVYPMEQRQKLHPDASFLQIIAPVQFSSPCIDYNQKPGC